MKNRDDREIPKQNKKSKKEIRGIVRIVGVDMEGNLKLKRALPRVKGVGLRTSQILSAIIFRELSIPETTVVGELSDDDVKKVEQILANPVKYGVPEYLVNRQRDLQTGQAMHFTGTDLSFTIKKDIEREKAMNSWKGYRHMYGQKVRGQRSRTTGRKGMSVGVVRKSLMAKKAGAKSKKGDKK
ncbi:MAG: 30S ribosomal protein S13 [Candidatus Micrarchaeota archaeon]